MTSYKEQNDIDFCCNVFKKNDQILFPRLFGVALAAGGVAI